jgi:hypothetical protein
MAAMMRTASRGKNPTHWRNYRQGLKIDALAIAKGQWEQTHPKSVAAVEMQQSDAGETATEPSENASQARANH